MKKSLLLVAAVFCAILLSATPKFKTLQQICQQSKTVCTLDSMYYYYRGELSYKEFYTYDNDGNLIHIDADEFLEGGYMNHYQVDYTYANGLPVTSEQKLLVDSVWVSTNKDTITYDENGNEVDYVSYRFDYEENVWVGNSHFATFHNGDTTTYMNYAWDSETQSWFEYYKNDTIRSTDYEEIVNYRPGMIPYHKIVRDLDIFGAYRVKEYTYMTDAWYQTALTTQDDRDYPTTVYHYAFDGVDTWTYNYREDYIYNSAQQTTHVSYLSYIGPNKWNLYRQENITYAADSVSPTLHETQDIADSVVTFTGLTEYTYDDHFNMTSELNGYFYDSDTAVTYSQMYSYVYDNDDRIVDATTAYWYPEGGYWDIQYRSSYEYDENGNQVRYSYYYIDWQTGEFTLMDMEEYFYSCVEEALESIESEGRSADKIFVNGQLYLVRDGHLFTLQGQLVK